MTVKDIILNKFLVIQQLTYEDININNLVITTYFLNENNKLNSHGTYLNLNDSNITVCYVSSIEEKQPVQLLFSIHGGPTSIILTITNEDADKLIKYIMVSSKWKIQSGKLINNSLKIDTTEG